MFNNILTEIKNWRKNFKRSRALVTTIIGLLPTIWDIGSDYQYATIWEGQFYFFNIQGLCYFFICLPVLMLSIPRLEKLIQSHAVIFCKERWIANRSISFLGNCLFFILLSGIVTTIIYLLQVHPTLFFYLSIPSAVFIIAIKVLAIFVQGEEMTKIATRVTAIEGEFEASFQILVVATGILIFHFPLDLVTISTLFSTFCAIGISGTNNLLTFGEENKLANTSLLQMVGLLCRYAPIFIMTTVFRTRGLCTSATFAHAIANYTGTGGVFIIPLVLALPFVILVVLKCVRALGEKEGYSKLEWLDRLSMSEMLRGALGEACTITMWGKLGREGSRNLQLAMATYYLVVYSVEIPIAMYTAPSFIPSALYNGIGGAALVCGWVAYPLYICQIFYMDTQWPWQRTVPVKEFEAVSTCSS